MATAPSDDLLNPFQVREGLLALGEFLRSLYVEWRAARAPLVGAVNRLVELYPYDDRRGEPAELIAAWRLAGDALVTVEMGDFPTAVLPARRVPPNRRIGQQELADFGIWNLLALATAGRLEELAVEVPLVFPGAVTDTRIFAARLSVASSELVGEWARRHQSAYLDRLDAEVRRLELTRQQVMGEDYGGRTSDELITTRDWLREWDLCVASTMEQAAAPAAPNAAQRGSGGGITPPDADPFAALGPEPTPNEVKRRAADAVRKLGREMELNAIMIRSSWKFSAGSPPYSSPAAVEFFREHWAPVAYWVRAVGELPEPIPTELPVLAHFDNEVIRFERFCWGTATRWDRELAVVAERSVPASEAISNVGSQNASDSLPPEPPVLYRLRADHARQQRNLALGAERLRLLSDLLATPTRPVRDRWFAAWRAVAEGVQTDDLDKVVAAIGTARGVFAEINQTAIRWLGSAREWLARAREVDSLFGSPVGLAHPGPFIFWESDDATTIPGLIADHGEFFQWALTVESVETLSSIPSRMRRQHYPIQPVIDHGLDLLELLVAGGTSDQFRELFRLTYGCRWLSGMTAVIAATLAPLAPDTRFLAAELPVDDQRECADYWLRLTEFVIQRKGYAEYFQQSYFTARSDSTGSGAELPVRVTETNVANTQGTPAETPAQLAPIRPSWNNDTRTLTVGLWSHVYEKSAPSQEQILAAFERFGWPSRVGAHLPLNLAGVLRNMRKTLPTTCPIEFKGDGAGGVRWCARSDSKEVSEK